jgi:exopolyphosphatase/guanosine-5'-triphosphate,3'-diphosphate pyrophosphatase
MAVITPRWEWRTFGTDFGAADGHFATLAPASVQESDETYLLSLESDANVKVRDALMDIKELVEVSPSGLEQWRPVMKATFPLSADTVNAVCVALGVAPPPSTGTAVTFERLKRGLAERGVRAVGVHKRRVRYTIDGCMSEMTEVAADGKQVRTVALESEDAERVLRAVRTMGLTSFQNIGYPSGLRALVGMHELEP